MPRTSKPQPAATTGPRLVSKNEPKVAIQPDITHEQIAQLAYESFERDGFAHGNHVDHWLRAERELIGVATVERPKRAATSRARG